MQQDLRPGHAAPPGPVPPGVRQPQPHGAAIPLPAPGEARDHQHLPAQDLQRVADPHRLDLGRRGAQPAPGSPVPPTATPAPRPNSGQPRGLPQGARPDWFWKGSSATHTTARWLERVKASEFPSPTAGLKGEAEGVTCPGVSPLSCVLRSQGLPTFTRVLQTTERRPRAAK